MQDNHPAKGGASVLTENQVGRRRQGVHDPFICSDTFNRIYCFLRALTLGRLRGEATPLISLRILGAQTILKAAFCSGLIFL